MEKQELLDKIFSYSDRIGKWKIVWGGLTEKDFVFGCNVKDNGRYDIYINNRKQHNVIYSTANEERALEQLYDIVKKEADSQLYNSKETTKKDINNSYEIYCKIEQNIMHRVKISHFTSQMVIHEKNGKYYLAVFILFLLRTMLKKIWLIDQPNGHWPI